MILHYGGGEILMSEDITAILDAQSAQTSRINRALLDRARREGRMHGREEGCASYVLVCRRDLAVYCSPISSLTLARRAGF
jgi:hypothetical protein